MRLLARLFNRLRQFIPLPRDRRSKRARLWVEQLEDRITPVGKGVVFLVNGYGGQQIPPDVYKHLVNDLFPQSAIHSWGVYVTNWNSPDPTSKSGFPGSMLKEEIDTQNILGTDVPVAIHFDPMATPSPVSPEGFITTLTNILETQYDNQDFIALIGHSLGAASVLEVANRLGQIKEPRKIDFLATLDPVGFSFNTFNGDSLNVQITPGYSLGGQPIIPSISVNIPVTDLQGAIDPHFFDPAPATQVGPTICRDRNMTMSATSTIATRRTIPFHSTERPPGFFRSMCSRVFPSSPFTDRPFLSKRWTTFTGSWTARN